MTRCVVLFLVSLVASSTAFTVFPQTGRLSETSLNIFGGLSDAFKNDDKLAPRKNEGLSGVRYNCCDHDYPIENTPNNVLSMHVNKLTHPRSARDQNIMSR